MQFDQNTEHSNAINSKEKGYILGEWEAYFKISK